MGYLSDFTFRYDPEHYPMMTLPLPLRVRQLRLPVPLVGLPVEIDAAALQALLLRWGTRPRPGGAGGGDLRAPSRDHALRGGAPHRRDGQTAHARVLGPQIVREIPFHALHEGGPCPAGHGQPSQPGEPDSPGAAYRDGAYREPDGGGELAREANMSVSAFHHHFRRPPPPRPAYIKTCACTGRG